VKKIVISFFVVSFLLVVLFFLIAPFLVKQLQIEAHIESRLNEQFGREISFTDMRVSFLPMPSVKIKDLRIKEKDLFMQDDLATVGTVSLQMDVFALFTKQIKIERFVFEEVNFFIREKDDKSNLKELIVDQSIHATEKKHTVSAPIRTAKEAQTQAKEPLDFVISELVARNVTVFYQKKEAGTVVFEDHAVIKRMNIKNFGFLQPVDFELEVMPALSPKPVMVAGTFLLDPRSVLDSLEVEARIRADQVRIKELALQYLGNTAFAVQDGFLSVDLVVTKEASEPSIGINGQMRAEKIYVSMIESLGEALPLLNATFNIDTTIDVSFDAIQINSFEARSGETAIVAEGTIDLSEKKLSCAVNSSFFDLADLPVLESYLKRQFPGTVTVTGPAVFNVFVEGNYFSQQIIGNIDLVNTDVVYADIYKKPKGFPIGLEVNLTAEAFNSLSGSFDVRFGSMTMKGDLSHLDLSTKEGEVTVHTNKFMLEPLGEQLFFTKDYIVNGKAKLFCNVRGNLGDILNSKFKLDVNLDDAALAHEYMQLHGLNGAFIIDPYAIEINNLELSLFQSYFKGWAKLENYQKKPNLNFDLYSTHCNLDSLLPAYDLFVHDIVSKDLPVKENRVDQKKESSDTQQETKSQQVSAPSGVSSSNADHQPSTETEVFRQVSGEGAFYIAELIYLNTAFNQLKGVIQMKDGHLRLTNATGDAFSGSVLLDGEINVASTPVLYAGTASASDIDLDRLSAFFQGPAQPSMIDGTVACALTVSGAGVTEAEVEKNLAGYGTVFVQNGELKNIDILAAVSMAKQFLGLRTHAYGGTRFDDITANFSIADGQVKTDDIYLASDDLTVKSAGTISLRGALDMNVEVLLKKEVAEKVSDKLQAGQVMSIPIHIGGTVEKPKYSIVGAAVRKIVDQFLQKGLKSLLKKVDVAIVKDPETDDRAGAREATAQNEVNDSDSPGSDFLTQPTTQDPHGQAQDSRASDKELIESAIRTGLDLLLKK
jgi:uncharacterized protein involved in outer membrane biogenesis